MSKFEDFLKSLRSDELIGLPSNLINELKVINFTDDGLGEGKNHLSGYSCDLPFTNPIDEEKSGINIETLCQVYTRFIEEFFQVCENQAVQYSLRKASSIRVPHPAGVQLLVEFFTGVIKKIFQGHPEYKDYVNKEEPESDLGEKVVMARLCFGIFNNKEDGCMDLIPLIVFSYWEVDKKDPSMITKVKDLVMAS